MVEQAFYLALKFMWWLFKGIFRVIALVLVLVLPPLITLLQTLYAKMTSLHQVIWTRVERALSHRMHPRPLAFLEYCCFFLEWMLYGFLLGAGGLLAWIFVPRLLIELGG